MILTHIAGFVTSYYADNMIKLYQSIGIRPKYLYRRGNMEKHSISIVNFVRGVESREPKKDLFLPVAEELRVNRKYGLKSTVLLQYDALFEG